MIYTKQEMYSMLADYADIDYDALDLVIKICGDTESTYLKILNTTEFKTFIELENYGLNVKWAE